jgi:hypothetical protein
MTELKNELRLRVMAEYTSSGICVIKPIGPFRHGMIEHKALRLPAKLAQEFNAWIEWYWDNLIEDGPALDRAKYSLAGLDLTQKLKDWIDWYWDNPEDKGSALDIKAFDAEGLRLAIKLKTFLGSDVYVEFQPEPTAKGRSPAQEIRLEKE